MPITQNSSLKALLPLILAAAGSLFSGCATAEPSSSSFATQKESHRMTVATPQNPQTLWEMFGDPNQWEMHIYTFPLNIETIKPLKPEDLRKKIHGVAYQHITDDKVIANSIEALKNIYFSDRPHYFTYTRALIEFKHKNKNEIIALSNDGDTSIFYVKKISEDQIDQLPQIVIHDMGKYKILRELFKNIY